MKRQMPREFLNNYISDLKRYIQVLESCRDAMPPLTAEFTAQCEDCIYACEDVCKKEARQTFEAPSPTLNSNTSSVPEPKEDREKEQGDGTVPIHVVRIKLDDRQLGEDFWDSVYRQIRKQLGSN